MSGANAQGASDQPTAQTGELTLEEITITAQRREESLQRAAIAVSAVSGDDIVEAGVTKPDDLARMVPALQVQPTGGTGNNFYLRGVGTQGANAFAENAVAFSVDGIFSGRANSMTGYFYDLERVEVLKGPQGTLYGRNATGGAVNVITKKPQLGELGGDINLEYGSYNLKRGSGALNAPLGDAAALRIAVQAVDRDGYYDNGYDDEEGSAARVQFRIEPSDAWSVTLSGNVSQQGGKGAGSVLVPDSRLPLAPAIDDRVSGAESASLAALQAAFPGPYANLRTPQNDGYIDGDFWGVNAEVNVQLPFADLTLLPGYQHADTAWLSYRPGFRALQTELTRQQSLEARLASSDEGALQYVLGAFYFDQSQDARQQFQQTLGAPMGQQAHLLLDTTSYAAFGQLTWSLADTLRLVGGLRYTREDKSQDAEIGTLVATTLTPVTGDLSFSDVSWKAGIEFDAADDSLLYASVATGIKAGGFYGAAGANTFDPENLLAYTLGSKNRFLDGRMQLNAELFYWDYQDQQVTYIGGVELSPGVYGQSGVTANVGQARMYGAELELEYLLTDRDRVGANVQYLDAKYSSFKYLAFSQTGAAPVVNCSYALNTAIVPSGAARFYDVDCSGKPAINSPEWVVTLGYEHSFNLPGDYQLGLALESKYETSRYLNIEYLDQEQQDAYIMSNASLTLRAPDERWSLAAWVNNIEDEAVKNQAILRPIVNVVYAGLRAPRTYGLRASCKF